MNKEHLSDPELQEYALNGENCPPQFNEHIQSCNFCRQKAELYQLMFSSEIKPEAPIFDFDLTQTVMQQLPVPQPTALEKSYTIYWVGASVFLSAGALIYLIFMTSRGFLFGKITPMTLGISITTFLAIFAVLGIDIFQKHTKQMKVLQSELQQFGSLSV
ncbi:MAG: hypothetical protein LCH91_09865 [Bacteroidetes bacterium]|nr:hypothetical protein [Bacteroidota bacterium]